MNNFDKNFHINFSPLYFAFAFMMFMLWASEAKASEIENERTLSIWTCSFEGNTFRI